MSKPGPAEAGRPRIHRPAASASWEADHQWGSQFGDSWKYSVTRLAAGGITIRAGKETLEIRSEMVAWLADAIAQAAAWEDS